MFNAIPDLGTARPDFLDRSLIIEFPELKPERRRDEAQFWREFDEARPQILGALLDAGLTGLKNFSDMNLDRLPRMAAFAIRMACEAALGMAPGEALASYRANRVEAAQSRTRGLAATRAEVVHSSLPAVFQLVDSQRALAIQRT